MSFYPVNLNDETIVRGPGRAMFASMSVTVPTQIGDVLSLSTFLPAAGWNDLGATKGGVSVTFNNSEESIDVDQVLADIATYPTGTEMSVSTQLAEASLDRFAMAWEGSAVTTNATPTKGTGPEKSVSFGAFEGYTQRRLAVAYRRQQSGKVRVGVFRITQRAPQESTITFNKTGDQQTIPVTWKVLPDTSVADVKSRFATFFDQV
jgi:hypothetical protein